MLKRELKERRLGLNLFGVFVLTMIFTPLALAVSIPENKSIGTWDPVTRTYVLTQDVSETIEISEDNLTLDGAGHRIEIPGIIVDSSAIVLSGRTGLTIQNLNVSAGWYGLYIENSTNNVIRNLNIFSGAWGIYLRSSSGNTLAANTVVGCKQDALIFLSGSSNNTLTGNTVLEGRTGIATDGFNNIVTGNTVSSNQAEGICCFGSYNSITDNTLSNNESGIITDGSNTTVTGNTISNNGSGIWLAGSNTVTVNTISNNGCAIVLLNSGQKIYNNNFIGNSLQTAGVAGNQFNQDRPIGGNYWSHWTGPDADGDGFVDVPYVVENLWLPPSEQDIDYLPWTVPNGWIRPDSDGDGTPDDEDAFPSDPAEWADNDGDGIGDNADTDDDNDGLSDSDEVVAGTNPCNPDTDGDGVNDGGDALPNDPQEWADNDGDGIGDNADPDDDNDALSDSTESAMGTDPLNPDTDGDGLLDGTEVEMAQGSGCPNPLNPDSDGDTLPDGAEVTVGTNPCDNDSDGDNVPDNLDPFPLNPEGTETYIETILRDVAYFIQNLNLSPFTGPNGNANEGRRGALSNRTNAAANEVADGNAQGAIDALHGILDRVDGLEVPKDWMMDSPEKQDLANTVTEMIVLLEYYI